MSNTPGQAPERSILPKWIRGPQDFIGGLVLALIAVFALWASSDLQGMQGFSFGAGTAPRMFAVLLLGLGIAVAVVGVVKEGPGLQRFSWRGPLFVGVAILTFSLLIRVLGLIPTAMLSFVIASLGTPEMRLKETLIVGACLTTFCALLFPYALGLPMQMWPTFLLR